MKPNRAGAVVILTVLFVIASGSSAHANDAAPLTPTPGDSVLLLDDHTVARTQHLTQQFFPAKKYPQNPVIQRTQDWEGRGPYVWGTSLLQDEQTGEFRLYYIAYDYAGNYYRWGLATSRNGIHWTKPDLGVSTFNGKPARNLLSFGAHAEKGARSVARDPRPETPAERRYLGIRFTYDGEMVAFSADGIHWTEHPDNPVWHVPSDIIHLMWDDRRSCFTTYYKLWEVKGTEVLPNGQTKPFLAHMPTFTNKRVPGKPQETFTGPVVHFHPESHAEVKAETHVLVSEHQGKDDGGGSSLSGSWTGKRVQAWASSNDGIHWGHEQLVLTADERDTPTSNIQYMLVIQQGGYYLGFLTLHDEAGLFRIQLGFSADGIHWKRPWRTPWLDIGPKGAFDSGMVLGPANPIFQKSEQWFPYGGFNTRHDSPSQDWSSAIGLAITRLDGYASWRASGNDVGELVTQPFRCSGDRLFVNADASHGSVTVEVLDDAGKVIPGFETTACKPIQADTLAGDGAAGWMRWSRHETRKGLIGKTIQLRFTLKDADLFAFRFADEKSMTLATPRAATR
jgi:hypothetical protein